MILFYQIKCYIHSDKYSIQRVNLTPYLLSYSQSVSASIIMSIWLLFRYRQAAGICKWRLLLLGNTPAIGCLPKWFIDRWKNLLPCVGAVRAVVWKPPPTVLPAVGHQSICSGQGVAQYTTFYCSLQDNLVTSEAAAIFDVSPRSLRLWNCKETISQSWKSSATLVWRTSVVQIWRQSVDRNRGQ